MLESVNKVFDLDRLSDVGLGLRGCDSDDQITQGVTAARPLSWSRRYWRDTAVSGARRSLVEPLICQAIRRDLRAWGKRTYGGIKMVFRLPWLVVACFQPQRVDSSRSPSGVNPIVPEQKLSPP